MLKGLSYIPLISYCLTRKVYGVSTRFIEDMVKRFGEDTASTANSAALENGGHGSEMDLPRSNSSSRKASGKSRSRNAWRKAENEVGPK